LADLPYVSCQLSTEELHKIAATLNPDKKIMYDKSEKKRVARLKIFFEWGLDKSTFHIIESRAGECRLHHACSEVEIIECLNGERRVQLMHLL
jgi:hypothetical protein